jgi:hypothetical protein
MKNLLNKYPIYIIFLEIIKGIKKRNSIFSYYFYRHLVKTWNTESLYQDIQESERDFKAGRYKTLNSVRDLM